MEQAQRTRIARGGLSFLLAAAVVFLVGLTNTYPSDEIIVSLVVVGIALAIGSQLLGNPVLEAVWLAPIIAAFVLYFQQETPGPDLMVQAVIVAGIGVMQVLFSQVGR
jgi:hypothetical protein